MKWPARGSLVWRLYTLGLVQLVLLTASVVCVGYLFHGALREPQAEGRPPAGSAPRLTERREGRRAPPPAPWGPLSTFFASGVLIVGVGAVLGWRWVARPLADLSAAARALGAGNLEARAPLSLSGELGELGERFNAMAERIEALTLIQQELLANVSHEVRTPLARIRVALDIASEGDALAARGSLEEIAVDLAELERVIDDISTSTRFDLQGGSQRTGFPLRRRHVAPGSIAQQASERFRARYPERGLRVHVAEALPEIMVDATLFRRVIDNLLDNAHRYSPGESPITLGVEGNAGGPVVFEIADQGMGISKPDLPRVFEPFFRAERSRFRGTGGAGLGLTLAKRIVEAHGGQIDLDSSAGGTRARVRVEAGQVSAAGGA
jgi:two-component system OmpR family sensor kinase